MTSAIVFSGFEEPTENFYRLPNTWFSDIIPLLRESCGIRFASCLKLLEYLLRHTWRFQEWNGKICLTAREIRDGKRHGAYRDAGTGISENTVKTAGAILNELGLITIAQNHRDSARRVKTYSPWITLAKPKTDEQFHGFVAPESNYFMVPQNWTNLTKDVTSAATIIIVEYAFRHSWGYHNEFGVWLTADEFSTGRSYKTAERKYDKGTGFNVRTIYRALAEAVRRGFMTYVEVLDSDHQIRRVYNLRFAVMTIDPKTGRCLSHLPENAITNPVENMNITTSNDTHAEGRDTIEEGGDIVTSSRPSPLARGNDTLAEGRDTIEEARDIGTSATPIQVTRGCDILAGASDTVEEGRDTLAEGIRTIEARSLTNTKPLNTNTKTPPKTLQRVAKKKVLTAVVDVELPKSILACLEQIGWTDTLTEVQNAYAEGSDRVRAWLDFALHAPGVRNAAGLFRKGIRSRKMPPYQIRALLEDVVESQEQSAYTEDYSEEYVTGYATETELPAESEAILAWECVQNQLQLDVPRAQFNTYLRPARAISLSDNALEVDACSPDGKEWLDSRIRRTAENILIGVLNRNISVQFITTQ